MAPTREELQQSLDPGVRPPEPVEELGIEEAEPAPPVPVDDATSFSFILRGLEIANATVYGDDDFRAIYEPFLDTEVTIGSLREIANRIEQLYRDDGYVATRVILPPQAIEDGIARLEVFEGRIIHYEINGEIGPVKKQIARLLDNLLTGEPARWSELERYLLLARDLPGISLTGTLRSAGETAPGGVILVVDTARKPVDGFVSLQNRNAEATGTFTASGGVALNSNTQWGERIGGVGLLGLEVPEQISGYLSYEQSLGDEGLRVYFSALHGYSEPGDLLEELDLVSTTTIVDVGLEYPIVRSRRFSLWTRGGFQYEDQHVEVGDPGRELLDDQLRVVYGGARLVALPPLGGVTRLDVEVRQGLDSYGAGVSPGVDANTDFTLIQAEASHRQPIPPFFEIYVGARAQRASEPLPSLEEMSLGELTVGRGFEPGSLTGDHGLGLTGELRYFPPGLETWWLQDFSVFGFYEYGMIDDFGNPTGNPEGYENLSSAGFGVRFQAFDTLFGEFYYAQPLDRALETAERRPYGGVKFTLTKFF
ncbi:MAG TPA: POTRA domain-containing protein [Paracoccaceae bacterium]|nr:POTRA domain-containing protein [Paracoccaceae bacterium]